MNKIINIENIEGSLVVSSREIAGNFEKRHSHVIEAIENKIKNLTSEKSGVEINKLFIPSQYEHNGNVYNEYLLTRDGFSFLVMGFTGSKADIWKLKYIEVFNKMEQELREPRKLSAMEQLKLQYEVIEDHDERLTHLENNMTIDYGQQRNLQDKAKGKAIKCLGGINSPAYKDRAIRSKVFAAIWNDYKGYFQIGSYRDTSRAEFDRAINYLHDWKVPGRLLREIEDCNQQMSL